MGIIREKMIAIFDTLPDEATEADIIALAHQFKDLARLCERTELFKRSQERYQSFKEEFEENSEHSKLMQAWIWLINRIAQAPTSYHMQGAVVLCVPLVAEFLPEGNQQ